MDAVQMRAEIELRRVAIYHSLIESLEETHVGLRHVVLVLQQARGRKGKLGNQVTRAG